MSKQLVFAALAAVTMSVLGMTALNTASAKDLEDQGNKEFKNVIFMVPDGCSQSIQTLARWYKGEDLTLDSMSSGMVRTDMANSVITGSAAAATAFSSGHKTTVRFLGVGPREEDLLTTFDDFDPDRAYAPMATILEAAKVDGKATGLVSTSRITHATPAAFACHIHDRGMDNEIMEHMVYNGLTVSLGGGQRHLLPASSCPNAVDGGKRTDCENLQDVLLARGYDVVTTKDEMDDILATPQTKLWGSFNMSHMDSDIDRVYLDLEEPSIAEMTTKAIEVLSQDDDGFFMMVEGSQVDWAGHNNDGIWMLTDFLAFDEAVKVALDFAKEDGETLVVAFPDHNTGGMKIGHYDTYVGYTETTVEDLIGPFQGMQVSTGLLASKLGDYGDDLEAAIEDLWGLDATQEDVDEIYELASDVGLAYAIARVISKNHTVVGWTTHGHNGEDVPVWIYPQSAAIGTIDNTELPAIGQAVDLDTLTEELYIDVNEVFEDEWLLDESDPMNPVLVVEDVRMPISKDYAICNDKTHNLGSLVVYAPMTGKVYVPEKAVALVDRCEGKKKGKKHDDDEDDD